MKYVKTWRYQFKLWNHFHSGSFCLLFAKHSLLLSSIILQYLNLLSLHTSRISLRQRFLMRSIALNALSQFAMQKRNTNNIPTIRFNNLYFASLRFVSIYFAISVKFLNLILKALTRDLHFINCVVSSFALKSYRWAWNGNRAFFLP